MLHISRYISAFNRGFSYSGTLPILSSSVCLSALICMCAANAAPVLPPAATSGGVEPSRTQEVSPPETPGEVFLIPPLIDRPLGADEGQRLFVKTITMRGVINRPESGIFVSDVRKLVEKYRKTKQRVNEEVTEGFTKKELQIGAKLVRKLLTETEEEQPKQQQAKQEEPLTQESAYKTVIQDLRLEMYNRQLTIGRLQEIANEVTRYYRSRGFILAQAYVPAQTVTNGDVVIQVIEGNLGQIIVENNHDYLADILTRPFAGLIGQPVYKDRVESSMLKLRDYPGLDVFGVFSPGTDVGSTNLILKVQREHGYDQSVSLDNFGSEYTGRNRLQYNVSINNPSKSADIVNLSVLKNFTPSNGLYGSFNYERPYFINDATTVGLDLSRNTFDLGGDVADLKISGVSKVYSIYTRTKMQRTRKQNSNITFTLSRKDANLSSPILGSAIDSRDRLATFSIEYGFDSITTKSAGINVGSFKLTHGYGGLFGAMQPDNDPTSSRVGGSGKHAGGDFNKFSFRYDRLQKFTKNQSLLLTLSGQYSNDLLISIEQMSVGGPDSVRAYSVSEYLFDKAYFGSLEWLINAPGFADKPVFNKYTWGELFKIALFLQTGGGSLNDPLPSETDSASLSGAGLGLRFNYSGFSMDVNVAKPISDKVASNGHDPQYYANLKYKF